MVKLIDVTGKVVSGEWGNDDLVGNGIPVLRTTNFNNDGTINYDNIVTRSITKTKINDKYLLNGDILIEKSGGSDTKPVGRVVYFEGEEKKYLYNNFTGLLRIKDKKEWYPKYIFYSLYANYKRGGTKIYQNKTTGLHNLKTENYISTFCIKQIPLQEQVDICNKLNRIKNIIDKKQLQLVEYAKLTHSLFVEMFGDTVINPLGWEEHKLEEYIDFLTSGSRGWAKYFVNEENELFLTIKNVKNNKIVLDDIQYIKAPKNKEAERTKVKCGDLLISITADLGRTGVIDKDISSRGAYINQHLSLVRLDQNRINPQYISYYLETDAGKRQFCSKNQNGVKAGLNFDAIKSLNIIVPPIELQDDFVKNIYFIDKHKFPILD